MNGKYKRLIIYSIAHCCVDFACAYLLWSRVALFSDFMICLVLYNFCAFALQMPLGILVDRWNRNSLVAAGGCLLIALSYLLAINKGGALVVTALLLGIGNAMFHLGGGVDTLNSSEKKAAFLGIFVAPGALGLVLGSGLMTHMTLLVLTPIVLVILAVLILTLCGSRTNVAFSAKTTISAWWILPLFLVVVLRSYMGIYQTFPWKTERVWAWILLAMLVLGKASGGIVFDRMKLMVSCVGTLVLSAVFYLFSGNPYFGFLAVFLFNMTMPITLWAVTKIMPDAKGFGFGMLTFGLFVGYLPNALLLPTLLVNRWCYALVAILSALLLTPPLVALQKKGLLS